MNDSDIRAAVERSEGRPVLNRAVRFLQAFAAEVNQHSDGWSTWNPPLRAANKLMELIQAYLYHDAKQRTDIAAAAYAKALSPIKAFYTRRGNQAGMKFPEVK